MENFLEHTVFGAELQLGSETAVKLVDCTIYAGIFILKQFMLHILLYFSSTCGTKKNIIYERFKST